MALAVSGSGFVVVGSIVMGLWLDRALKTGPWLSLAGLIVGFGSGIGMVYRLVQMSRKGEE